MIGALALGALWIVGLHWWSLLLVAAFVAVGFAAVARAEQLDKTDSEPGEPEPPADADVSSPSAAPSS